jgi:hypothetical protein
MCRCGRTKRVLRLDHGEVESAAMTADITRAEFSQVEARLSIGEREVEGEKVVTRHILEQTRRNSDDLAAIKSRLDRVEHKLDNLDHSFHAFVRDFPVTVTEIMRDVLREDRDR